MDEVEIRDLLEEYHAFKRLCEEEEYTDTGEAWVLIDRLAECIILMLD